MVSTVSQKILIEVGDTPPLIQENFDNKKIWENENKAVMLRFLCIQNFHTRKFLNYKRVRLRSFLVLREKQSPKNWCLSLPIHKSFSYQKVFET